MQSFWLGCTTPPGPLHTPDAEIFKDVLAAQRLRRKLLVRYRSLSSNRTWQRRISPYHLFNHHGDWYVAAWDERRKDVRIFALHRIRRATRTTEPFEVPKRFNFKKYMADAFAIQKGEEPATSPSASPSARPEGTRLVSTGAEPAQGVAGSRLRPPRGPMALPKKPALRDPGTRIQAL